MNDALVETLDAAASRRDTASLTPNVEVCGRATGMPATVRFVVDVAVPPAVAARRRRPVGSFPDCVGAPALVTRARRVTLATEQLFAVPVAVWSG